ncbi:VIN3-like protein 2 isoform X1 [Cryptomeria japonica]|uniref:VIN3-like protein 2 isoform X1 n=1 Tax=Cryptomeria japonica TaxID=3369 RepID=UPI0027DA8A0B|nr:VIN3-like protein 2 isoform X1 [Cryptomeria japonica]
MSRPGFKSASVNSSLTGPMLDATKRDQLTMLQKHELVYDIVKGSECSSEILQSWTRKEILHLICAEMGKERKYTGLPKCKMIEHLLRIVASKESMPQEGALLPFVSSTPANAPSVFRRQRKKDHPLRLTTAATLPVSTDGKNSENNLVCKNSACRAILSSEDMFCKRCSCCICCQFDDNKDPSLWLVCSSEPLDEDISCGLSCHIECALKHRNAGVVKVGQHIQLDGSYCCAFCGRVSGLIGFWKKQLNIAKDARRVDILCYRLSLSQRLLNGTDQFKELHDIVLKAVRKLEEEVGPINGVSSKMARGIVSRLSSGFEVQKLCAKAIEKAETLLSSISPSDSRIEKPLPAACRVHFEDVTPTSLLVSLKEIDLDSSEGVVYKLWHRKSRESNFPRDLTCILPRTQMRALISDLQPCTEYAFKIVAYTDKGDIGQTEAKCFTKSVEVFRRNRESSMIKGVSKKCGNLGMEDFTSISVEGARENQSNEDASSFRVRDLGKIWRTAWAQECEANDAFDSSERNIHADQFGYEEKDEACDSDKQFASDDSKRNGSPTSPLEVSRDDQIGCNLVQVAEPEDDQEEAVSVLDDERLMAGIGLVKMSHDRQGSTKDLKKLKNGCWVNKSSKRKRENLSKVTSQKSINSEQKQLALHEMDLVPLDCSYPVFPVNKCKAEYQRTGRFRNPYANSNGNDSGNWAVQPIMGAPAVESQTGFSRKRSLNAYDNLHAYDGVLPNGSRVPSSDPLDCLEKDFESSVKIIRWLECEGHIKEEFRKKLLTWFSLRSTAQERRIIYAFINTLLDDPTSLAEQLVDTFLEISSNKKPQFNNGFCTKLWH